MWYHHSANELVKYKELYTKFIDFKLSDCLKDGHMDYFQQCPRLKTNPCVLVFTISLTVQEAVTAAEFGTR